MNSKTILVVDDDNGALTLISIMLQRGEFKVLTAEDPADALQQLDHAAPDLIILDVMMPERDGIVDGIELCRAIRTRDNFRETPVLILSALGDGESVMRGMEAGATDYLPKPILHHDLVTKVREMLGSTV